jgi:hypothetical protein
LAKAITLNRPIVDVARIKDKTGRVRSYGAGRRKRSFRIRDDLWERLTEELKHSNEYMNGIIEKALDEGLKVLARKRARKEKRK